MSANVQYGCGLSAPLTWINFDASPTLRLQKIPVIGTFVKKVNFPKNVLYGDIIKGLPGIAPDSCDTVYCSHVLEHMSFEDCRTALINTFRILKKGGLFRCVLPDLEQAVERYQSEKSNSPELASTHFMQSTMLGLQARPAGLWEKIIFYLGNSHHLWMWDHSSLIKLLREVGFSEIRRCQFNDSENKHFIDVEDESRFWSAIALEATK